MWLKSITVATNGIIEPPEHVKSHLVISRPADKMHGPMYISPTDLGKPINNCGASTVCGMAVDAFGYYPCGAGASLIRLFQWTDQIKYDFPDDFSVWDYNRICAHCVHGYYGCQTKKPIQDPMKVWVSPIFMSQLSKAPMEFKRL
jgi:hypothetical protein